MTAPGAHSISFHSVDPAGNTEAANTQSFTVNYPVPVITTLALYSRTAGTGTFTETINGSNFTAATTVLFGSTVLTPSAWTPTSLTVSVPGSLILVPKKVTIKVVNPAPGGGTSNGVTFTIKAPVLLGLTVSPTVVVGGLTDTGKVRLTGPALAGGMVINVSSLNPAVANPAVTSVTVPAGAISATFLINTVHVTVRTAVTIKAVDPKGTTKTATLTIK